MKKARCRLCGKKLNNGVCPDCGLRESHNFVLAENQSEATPRKKTALTIWCTLSIILIILPWLLYWTPLRELTYIIQEQQIMRSIPEYEYVNAVRELNANGTSVELTLSEGNYIVGIDIAEGNYQINPADDSGSIMLQDEVNQISFTYRVDNDSDHTSSYLQDVRLYQDAIIRIERGGIMFTSSNAQVESLQTLPPNETPDTYCVEDGAVAGADFPEGTYDITMTGGEYGRVEVSHPKSDLDSLDFNSVMGIPGSSITEYRNVEFPKGTMIEFSDIEITLVPSVRNSLTR